MNEIDDYGLGKKAGRNEAWKAINKITAPESKGGLSSEELLEIFGYANCLDIFHIYNVDEVITRIKEYEDKLKIGDEIITKYGSTGIVTMTDVYICVLWGDGSAGMLSRSDLKKTGKNYPQIKEMLKQLKVTIPEE